jgi:hypothetical protein
MISVPRRLYRYRRQYSVWLWDCGDNASAHPGSRDTQRDRYIGELNLDWYVDIHRARDRSVCEIPFGSMTRTTDSESDTKPIPNDLLRGR